MNSSLVSPAFEPSLQQRAMAEFLGTMFLLIGVLGSGIMAARLTDDVGLQLFQNAFATAGILAAIILTFGWVSGAHFNPAVTLAARIFGELSTRVAAVYVGAQILGGIAGAIAANLMFDLDPVTWSQTERYGANLWFSEVVATVGLLLIIWGTVRGGGNAAYAVAAYIGGAYYFTSSTSFANPAVTIARMFSNTFAGIQPASAPWFIMAQLVGVALAVLLIPFVFMTGPKAQRTDTIQEGNQR